MATDEDSAWKDILDTHFAAFIAFFFPELHHDIDWAPGYETLDKELEAILRGSKSGKRLADKLVKVRLRSGCFPSSLSRDRYEMRRGGFELSMRFPVANLLAFEDRRAELEANRSPFAVVVLAHLEARRTRGEPAEAFEAKWRLVRMLYERRYKERDVIGHYKFIDWVVRLPEDLEIEIGDRVTTLEGRKTMPYVSSIERFAKAEGKEEGREEGKAEGLRDAIALGLKLRFGPEGLRLLPRLRGVRGEKALRAILTAVHKAKTLDALREKLEQA